MNSYIAKIEVQTLDGVTHRFDDSHAGRDKAKACAINDIKAYAKQYGNPEKVKGMQVASINDNEFFMVDLHLSELLSPSVTIDDVLIDENNL